MSKVLPVGSNLLARNIDVCATCKRCGEAESELHVLLTCPFAARVWELLPANFKPNHNIPSPANLLQSSLRLLPLPPTGISSAALHPWVCWLLWKNRNSLLFENKSITEHELVLKAIREARAFQEAQLLRRTAAPPPSSQKPRYLSAPSPLNQVHLLVDAAWHGGKRLSGLGWVFRSLDKEGITIKEHSTTCNFVPSALMAETLAVKAALLDAVSSGFKSLSVYSDCKSLITLLNAGGPCVEIQGLVHDISILCSSFDSIQFVFLPRSCNGSADLLAKQALFSIVHEP